jgi:FtsH-binding integral membrane protein
MPGGSKMNKPMKLGLTILVTILLYACLFFVLVVYSTPENHLKNLAMFIMSAIFMALGIPVGIGLTWLLDNKMPAQKNSILSVFALIWGLLFGWLTLLGVAIGQYIIEKEKPTTPTQPPNTGGVKTN